MKHLVLIVTATLLTLCFALPSLATGNASGNSASSHSDDSDIYFTMQIGDLLKAHPDAHLHSRICVAGIIVSKPSHEKDGDIHIKLGDGEGVDKSHTIILEIIPQYPILAPRKGQVVTACGIVRWDGWHKWWEIHPLLQWDTASTPEASTPE